MKHLRAIFRIFAFVIFTVVMYGSFLLTRITLLISAKLALRLQAAWFTGWARGVAFIVGMRVNVEGKAPKPPFFMVSNHLSYMDIILLATQVDAFFVAKSEVANWPVMGHLAKSMNTIFVDRSTRSDVPRVIGLMNEVLQAGHGVVFFPEGTSSKGEEVLRFKTALFDAPLRMGYPVHCTSLSYKTPEDQPPAHMSVCWWGDMPFGSHFYDLLGLTCFEATLVFGEGVLSEDRRAFADACGDVVRRGFIPVMAYEESA